MTRVIVRVVYVGEGARTREGATPESRLFIYTGDGLVYHHPASGQPRAELDIQRSPSWVTLVIEA